MYQMKLVSRKLSANEECFCNVLPAYSISFGDVTSFLELLAFLLCDYAVEEWLHVVTQDLPNACKCDAS